MTVLEVQAARKAFGEIQALAGVSFQVAAGETVGLLGPNGSGKSTLMRSIATLEHLDGGSVRVAGSDASRDPAGVRRHLGYAGQEAAVDKIMTGREFLRFQGGLVHLPPAQIAARADEMLRRLDLEAAADRRTEGYSGGMRRRLDLAASLMHRPELLVLDEPSAGLDYDARRRLWDFLLGMKAGGSAMLIGTHDFEEADALCDRVLLMASGRVAAQGPPAELRRQLGSWVVSAALNEHPQEGDADRLAGLFEGLSGQVLPPDPRRAEFAMVAPPAEEGDDAGRRWAAQLEARAAERGTPLFSLMIRRPTLQDVYRAEVGEAFDAREEEDE